MIRVFRSGPHANRMPLSYPALASLFEDRFAFVDRPADADIYLFAHVLDVQECAREVAEDWRVRRRPIVILSEEPFWDTIWGRHPTEAHIYVETSWGAVPVSQINHVTSSVFRFDRIPYYLLTNPRFERSYRRLFIRNASRTAADWLSDFQSRPVDISFMFERRPEAFHSVEWPQADLTGLCAWRTELAIACNHGSVERLGQSWQGGASRFEIKGDWHADKLSLLDGRARVQGAIENTHHPDYISEKIFDAFACGALPLYWASPRNGVHRFGLPESSWLNLHGLSPDNAAQLAGNLRIDIEICERFAEAQGLLRTLFCDDEAWESERRRLARAVKEAVEALL